MFKFLSGLKSKVEAVVNAARRAVFGNDLDIKVTELDMTPRVESGPGWSLVEVETNGPLQATQLNKRTDPADLALPRNKYVIN